jgi:HlyD family secretion protein
MPASAAPAGGFKKGERPPPDEKTLYTLEGEKLEPHKVKVGVTDGSVTEIMEGIDEGAQVVTDANDGSGPKKQSGSSPLGGGGGRRMF